MIQIKNNLVRVRCLECNEEHFIEMKHVGTDKVQRTIGYEYEHVYSGELKCSHCSDDMKLLTTIWEFPKGILNHHETKSESCLIMDDIDFS